MPYSWRMEIHDYVNLNGFFAIHDRFFGNSGHRKIFIASNYHTYLSTSFFRFNGNLMRKVMIQKEIDNLHCNISKTAAKVNRTDLYVFWETV